MDMISEDRVRALLEQVGAIREGHFVGTSGTHLSHYVAKDQVTKVTSAVSELCMGIAAHFASYDIDAVVVPAIGAVAIAQWSAHHLTQLRPDRPEVLALYAEPYDEVTEVKDGDSMKLVLPNSDCVTLNPGDKVIVRRQNFVLKRGFNVDVRGKRVLGGEDILTTGGSAAKTVQAIEGAGGIVVAMAALVNGGRVTADKVGASELFALLSIERQQYSEDDCQTHGLCARGVPINTDLGHGSAFLARKTSTRTGHLSS